LWIFIEFLVGQFAFKSPSLLFKQMLFDASSLPKLFLFVELASKPLQLQLAF